MLTLSAATKRENAESWKAAIKTELDAIAGNNTWKLVPRTEASNILTSKWVFKCKDIAPQTESIARSTAHVSSAEASAKEGIDYHETYAPVVKFTTLRMFLAIVAYHDLHCHQTDARRRS